MMHETALSFEEKTIKKSKDEPIEIIEIISQCLSFYSSKIEEEDIQVREEYVLTKPSFTADKKSFYQLLLNLFHKALERTPKHGSILITIKESKIKTAFAH